MTTTPKSSVLASVAFWLLLAAIIAIVVNSSQNYSDPNVDYQSDHETTYGTQALTDS